MDWAFTFQIIWGFVFILGLVGVGLGVVLAVVSWRRGRRERLLLILPALILASGVAAKGLLTFLQSANAP